MTIWSGAFAGRMWWQLRALGHQNIAVLDGGLKYWLAQNHPMSTEIVEPISKRIYR